MKVHVNTDYKTIESTQHLEHDKLQKGETGKMTIVFEEPVFGFTLDSLYPYRATLSNLQSSDGGQTWTLDVTPEKGATEGLVAISANGAKSADGAGITGYTAYFIVGIDSTPPNSGTTTITIDAVADDNVINNNEKESFTIKGTVGGEFRNGDTVTIQLNGQEYSTRVNDAGKFSVTVTPKNALIDGEYTISASVAAQDLAGNVNLDGSIKTETQVKVVTKLAGELEINDFVDSANPFVTNSDTDHISNDNNFTLNVSDVDSGSQVVYQQNINGAWKNVDATQSNLQDGEYTFRAQITDAYGNSKITTSQKVTIDTTADATPTDLTQDGTILSGKGTVGSTIVVRNADNQVVANVVVSDDNTFSIDLGVKNGNFAVTSVDLAGNVSEAGKINFEAPIVHHKVFTAASGVDSQSHLLGYKNVLTSDNNDWIEIGNGAQDCWTCGTQGNIWNAWPHLGWTTLDTGAGNDRIDTGVSGGYGNMYAYTSVDMGSGNDILNIKGQMYSNSFVDMGTGDDVIHIGGNIHNHASVQSLSGNNVLVVGEDIDDYAKVLFGNGNDIIEVGEDVEGMAQVITGSGDDSVSVKYDVEGRSIINTGEGNDTLSVGEDIEDCVHIDMGSGNDTLTVARFVENAVVVDMGDGDNTATMAGLNNWAHISFGSGNDQLNVTHQFGVGGGYATADMGAGDDTFTFGGIMPDGVVHGGSGLDTLVLTYDASAVATERCCHITNLASNNFTGFEHIELNGKNALDIRYSDLVNDSTRDGALYIKGNANSKVDLGATDWNSDTDKDFRDVGGGQWNSTGTQEVAGVEYQVYHHSAAGSDLSNDVYIQTGVIVI